MRMSKDEFLAQAGPGQQSPGDAAQNQRLRAALLAILDAVDYKAGNCRVNDMVGAVLPAVLIERAREALKP